MSWPASRICHKCTKSNLYWTEVALPQVGPKNIWQNAQHNFWSYCAANKSDARQRAKCLPFFAAWWPWAKTSKEAWRRKATAWWQAVLKPEGLDIFLFDVDLEASLSYNLLGVWGAVSSTEYSQRTQTGTPGLEAPTAIKRLKKFYTQESQEWEQNVPFNVDWM